MLNVLNGVPMYESMLRNNSSSQLATPLPNMAAEIYFVENKIAEIKIKITPVPLLFNPIPPSFAAFSSPFFVVDRPF